MKTTPQVITLILTLAALPVAAFAAPTERVANHTAAFDRLPVTVEHARMTLPADMPDTTVRFNLIDGQPIR